MLVCIELIKRLSASYCCTRENKFFEYVLDATFLRDHDQTRVPKLEDVCTQRLTETTWGGTTKGPMENHRIFCFIPSGENPECASLLGRMGGCKLNEHTTAYASSAVEPLRGYNKRSDGFPSEFLFYIIMELKHREHYNRVGKSKGGTKLVPPFLQMIENHFLCRGTRIRTWDPLLPKQMR